MNEWTLGITGGTRYLGSSLAMHLRKIIEGTCGKKNNSLDHVFSLFRPKPVTVYEMAVLARNSISKVSKRKIQPEIVITNTTQPTSYSEDDKKLLKINISIALTALNLKKLKSPKESIEVIVGSRFKGLTKDNDDFLHEVELMQTLSLECAELISRRGNG